MVPPIGMSYSVGKFICNTIKNLEGECQPCNPEDEVVISSGYSAPNKDSVIKEFEAAKKHGHQAVLDFAIAQINKGNAFLMVDLIKNYGFLDYIENAFLPGLMGKLKNSIGNDFKLSALLFLDQINGFIHPSSCPDRQQASIALSTIALAMGEANIQTSTIRDVFAFAIDASDSLRDEEKFDTRLVILTDMLEFNLDDTGLCKDLVKEVTQSYAYYELTSGKPLEIAEKAKQYEVAFNKIAGKYETKNGFSNYDLAKVFKLPLEEQPFELSRIAQEMKKEGISYSLVSEVFNMALTMAGPIQDPGIKSAAISAIASDMYYSEMGQEATDYIVECGFSNLLDKDVRRLLNNENIIDEAKTETVVALNLHSG